MHHVGRISLREGRDGLGGVQSRVHPGFWREQHRDYLTDSGWCLLVLVRVWWGNYGEGKHFLEGKQN